MGESYVVAILGAQLTIGGAIVLHAFETSVDGDQGDGSFGMLMIVMGVVFGLLAAVRAYRTEPQRRP